MVERIEVKVPVRVDLAGEWTDGQPYTSDFGGEVVNFAINKYIKYSIEIDEEGKKKVEYSSDIPNGSGLGTSGAMNEGLMATIVRKRESPEEIAELAFKFEELLENKGFRQDQWTSKKGDFNHLLFIGDEVEPLPFEPMTSAKNWLKKYFIIAHCGIEPESESLYADIWDRYKKEEDMVYQGLHCIRSAARIMARGLQQDRREMVVQSLRDVCKGIDMMDEKIQDQFRTVVNPLLENKNIVAWKALGTGGGAVGLLCSSNGKDSVIKAIEGAGWTNIEWDYAQFGIQIEKIT